MFDIYKDGKICRHHSVDGNKGKCCEKVHNHCFEAVPYLLFKKTQKTTRRHQVRIKTTNLGEKFSLRIGKHSMEDTYYLSLPLFFLEREKEK